MRKLTIIALICAACLSGAEFGGTWLGRIPKSNADGTLLVIAQSVAFKIVQSGTAVEGKFYGEDATTPITEGKVTADEISFLVIAPEQQGNSVIETHMRFTGHLNKDGDMEVTRIRESSTNASDGSVYKYRPENIKHTFVLKRLL